MDNLDRTNVVQAALAKWTVNHQLRALGILPATASIDDYAGLARDFRESEGLVSPALSAGPVLTPLCACLVWADHADLIAKAYGGSGALKSDFTRTNKRTVAGVLEDGRKSVLRYIKNNYFDGARQVGGRASGAGLRADGVGG